MNPRNATLAGSFILYAAISLALFVAPGWEVALYPFYGLIFIWNDFRREEEVHIIFLFLTTVAAALAMARTADASFHMALGLEAGAQWLLSFGLGFHRARMSQERHRILSAVENFDGKLRDGEREMRIYEAYQESAVDQIRMRRDLTQAAKSLGSTLDARELEMRLQRVLEGRYKGSRIQILPGTPPDPLVDWAVKSQTPVLVRDLPRDERFAQAPAKGAFRSAILLPLSVMKKPYGFVRMESDEASAFDTDDLRAVDLFATVASLTLENIQLYEEVKNLAMHDGLTGLYTQRAFRLRLKEELLRAGRSQSPLSLVMCDIDLFKNYNDAYGHQAGDEFLRSFARLLLNHTRPVDCVARYGGEEFALILPNVVHSQAVDLAGRIHADAAKEPFVYQGRGTRVTASFGVSSFPQDATSQSQIIRVADERLYLSKQRGRSQVTG
ncbi:MAG: GGDEF domain-containing protein [Elusimicrobia bacterium]|nr:GGDEF domain-containing protein [Elusimicrobiota bacterium]